MTRNGSAKIPSRVHPEVSTQGVVRATTPPSWGGIPSASGAEAVSYPGGTPDARSRAHADFDPAEARRVGGSWCLTENSAFVATAIPGDRRIRDNFIRRGPIEGGRRELIRSALITGNRQAHRSCADCSPPPSVALKQHGDRDHAVDLPPADAGWLRAAECCVLPPPARHSA